MSQNTKPVSVLHENYGCGHIGEKYDAYTKARYPYMIRVACSLLQNPEHTEESTRLETQQHPEEHKAEESKHLEPRGTETLRRIKARRRSTSRRINAPQKAKRRSRRRTETPRGIKIAWQNQSLET